MCLESIYKIFIMNLFNNLIVLLGDFSYFSSNDNIFLVLSLLALLCAVSVITVKNPIKAILFLIGLFVSISCYLIFMGLSFIGLSYLLVYVGAISILFLFILMLINIRTSELASETRNSLPLVIIITLIFQSASFVFPENFVYENNMDNGEINNAVYYSWENALAAMEHIASIGNILYTVLAILLLLVSMILLLAMVGAIVITIKPKKSNYEIKDINILESKSLQMPNIEKY